MHKHVSPYEVDISGDKKTIYIIKTLLGKNDVHNEATLEENDASNDKLIGSPQTECEIKLLPDINEEKDTKDDHFDTKHYLHMEDEKNMPLQMCSPASFISSTISSIDKVELSETKSVKKKFNKTQGLKGLNHWC